MFGALGSKTFIDKLKLVLGVSTKVQTKYLGTNLTGDVTDIPALRFNTLEIGKWYACYLNCDQDATNFSQLFMVHDGEVRLVRQVSSTGGSVRVAAGALAVFQATATTVTFNSVIASGTIYGNGTKQHTWVRLTDLPFYEETTQWT